MISGMENKKSAPRHYVCFLFLLLLFAAVRGYLRLFLESNIFLRKLLGFAFPYSLIFIFFFLAAVADVVVLVAVVCLVFGAVVALISML